MSVIECLLFAWNQNADYGRDLIADLSDEQMIGQPSPVAMNHPAWVISHLNAYLPIIQAVAEEQPFEDPQHHPFGMHSKPEMDASVYATREKLMNEFVDGHRAVTERLQGKDDAFLAHPVPLERWVSRMPTVGLLLTHLMVRHESVHLGQVSAWRRASGYPAV